MGAFKDILFNKPNGSIFAQKLFDPLAGDSVNNRLAYVRNGGIMTVSYIPVIGDCDYDARYGIGSPNKVSPFNADLSKLYIKLKGKAMTLGNYSAADVGKGMLALDSLYGLLAELDVDITSLNQYCFNNVAMRGMIQEILWRDPKTAQANLANIIKRRNNIAAKMEVLPFIPGIKFMQDHIDWARFIYKDDNLDKSSLIIFRRAGYYRWCCRTTDTYPGTLLLSDNTTGSGYARLDSAIIKAEDKFDILEMLLDDYVLDDEFTDLCAGIANAYGVDKDSYSLPKFPDDISKFTLEMKYDLDVIDSLRSADFFMLHRDYQGILGLDETVEGHLAYTHDFGYRPDGEFRVTSFTPISGTNPTQYKSVDTGEGRIVFSYEDNPTPESIDVIARYVHDYVHVNPTDYTSKVFGLKSEFLTGISVWYVDDDRSFKHIDLNSWIDCKVPGQTIFGSNEAESIFSTFIAMPMVYTIPTDGSGLFLGNKIVTAKKDIDNLGIIPRFANSTCAEEYMWNKFFGSDNRNSYSKKKKKQTYQDDKQDNPK